MARAADAARTGRVTGVVDAGKVLWGLIVAAWVAGLAFAAWVVQRLLGGNL